MDKNYTIYDLAAELDVTPSMVSRAFNPKARIASEKREMILAAANRRGFEPNKFASRLSRGTVRIGVLMVYKAEHVRDALLRGINEAYEKLRDYKIECEIKCISSSEKKAEQCREELFAFAEFDGVIVEGFGHSECTELINEFAKVNPNIVMLQNVCEQAEYLFTAKHDESLAARIAAELLRARLYYLKKRNVLLVTGSVNSSIHANVLKSFTQACKENGLNLVAHVDMNDDSDKAVALTEKYLGRRSTVDGIYVSSGNSEELCEYVRGLKKDIALITTDVHSGIIPYIENGTVFASICQNFAEQGYLAFDNLVRYIVEKTAPEKVLFSETVPVFRANLHLYKNK
jgi:LacI family transcriptional regulator